MPTVELKRKYTSRPEPANRINRPGFKNTQQGKGKAGGNMGSGRSKGQRHPIGLSGRTVGNMIRAFHQGKPGGGK